MASDFMCVAGLHIRACWPTIWSNPDLQPCLQTLDIIFYGDSITESWRGLQIGVPVEKSKGIPEVFAKAYGGVSAAVYSISGIPFQAVNE
jgi:hypothetical protein